MFISSKHKHFHSALWNGQEHMTTQATTERTYVTTCTDKSKMGYDISAPLGDSWNLLTTSQIHTCASTHAQIYHKSIIPFINVYIFTVYFLMLSACLLTSQSWLVALVNNKLKWIWKEVLMVQLRFYPRRTEENHKNPQLGQLLSWLRSELRTFQIEV
jgi:hypothetical protein